MCPLPASAGVDLSVPIETMESDLPCLGRPSLGVLSLCSCSPLKTPLFANGELLSEKAGRCPFLKCSGKVGGFRESFGRVEAANGAIFRCLSPNPCPLCTPDRAGDLSAPGRRATFLKVITHSTSSPANTVDCVNSMDARILEDQFEGMMVVGVRGALGRFIDGYDWHHRCGRVFLIST